MGKVRIFCDCGKEIWDSPDGLVRLGQGWSINQIEREAICSDCLMARTLQVYHAAAQDGQGPTP